MIKDLPWKDMSSLPWLLWKTQRTIYEQRDKTLRISEHLIFIIETFGRVAEQIWHKQVQ